MRRHLPLALGVLLATCWSAAALSAAQRTFVASFGNDANPCSLAQPCRSFGTAITQTSDNGEIVVLDSAGYGAVSITKSVSIIAPAGIYAGITVTSGAGVLVNAAFGSVHVRLQGLTINAFGAVGTRGIVVQQAASVRIEQCSVSGANQFGILVESASTDVDIVDTTVRANALDGVSLAQTARVTITDSRLVGNGNLGFAASMGTATLARTLVAGNANGGVQVATNALPGNLTLVSSIVAGNSGQGGVVLSSTNAPAPVQADIARNTIANNQGHGISFTGGTGIVVKGDASGNQIVNHPSFGISVVGASALSRLSGNAVFGNGTGLHQVGGTLYTLGDNYVRDNTSDTTGVMTADSPL